MSKRSRLERLGHAVGPLSYALLPRWAEGRHWALQLITVIGAALMWVIVGLFLYAVIVALT